MYSLLKCTAPPELYTLSLHDALPISEARALDAKYPDIRVLAGTEADIRQDGTIDYPDELLSQLDFVVASVHSGDRKSTRLNSSHRTISYAVFCLKKKTNTTVR